MRISPTSDFKKLWGRIEVDLPAGNYSFVVTNNYPVSNFGGYFFN